MNFANVKAITIPEGNVKQIADGQGNVLWKVSEPPTLSFSVLLYKGRINDTFPTNWSIVPSTNTDYTSRISDIHNGNYSKAVSSIYRYKQYGSVYDPSYRLGIKLVGSNLQNHVVRFYYTGCNQSLSGVNYYGGYFADNLSSPTLIFKQWFNTNNNYYDFTPDSDGRIDTTFYVEAYNEISSPPFSQAGNTYRCFLTDIKLGAAVI